MRVESSAGDAAVISARDLSVPGLVESFLNFSALSV